MIRTVNQFRLVAPCCNALSTVGGFTANVSKRYFGKKNPADETKTPIRFNRVFDPDFIQSSLNKVNDRLREAEKEKFGIYRGRDYMSTLLREEAPSKRKRARISSQVAMAKLATIVFERFALQQGQVKLKEVRPSAIAEAFFGPGTRVVITYQYARLILLELWRYGRSSLLEGFRKKHLEKLAQTIAIAERAKANKQKWKEADPLEESSDPGQSEPTTGRENHQSLTSRLE
jgi:hypothetical protein